MLECLLKLRADCYYRLGVAGQNKRHSIFLLASKQTSDISSNMHQNEVFTVDISRAVGMILTALKFENGILDFFVVFIYNSCKILLSNS